MAAIMLKNLPAGLHAQLKERARRHHRSLMGEVIAVLHEALSRRDSEQSSLLNAQRPAVPRGALPAFGTMGQLSPEFDLMEALRKDRCKADEELAQQLGHFTDDAAAGR